MDTHVVATVYEIWGADCTHLLGCLDTLDAAKAIIGQTPGIVIVRTDTDPYGERIECVWEQ